MCPACQEERTSKYFTDGADTCASCRLQRQFATVICARCGKTCRANGTAQDSNADAITCVCLSCVPHEAPLDCTICKLSKHPSAFEERYRGARAERAGIRRCKACSERCSECCKHIVDDREFATNSPQCWSCFRKKRVCASCQQEKHMVNAIQACDATTCAAKYYGLQSMRGER